MTEQYPNVAAISRTSDDETSHEAAEKLNRSGRRDTQKGIVLTALRAHPGSTASEIGSRSHLGQHVVARRLPDLLRDQLVYKTEARECRITGNRARTWRAVETQGDLF